jgi:hypothetical protein
VPNLPELPEWDWDLDDPGSRFTRIPAVAIGIPEEDWPLTQYDERVTQTVEAHFGEWILDEDTDLGRPEAVPGSTGRGAAGFAGTSGMRAKATAGVGPSSHVARWRRSNRALSGRGPTLSSAARGVTACRSFGDG